MNIRFLLNDHQLLIRIGVKSRCQLVLQQVIYTILLMERILEWLEVLLAKMLFSLTIMLI